MENNTENTQECACEDFNTNGICEHVHQDNVALPEVRTGKVDVEGDFEREQHTDTTPHVVFDTLAVPEYHTGKCEPIDHTQEKIDDEGEEKKHERHGFLSDLARTIANGGVED